MYVKFGSLPYLDFFWKLISSILEWSIKHLKNTKFFIVWYAIVLQLLDIENKRTSMVLDKPTN